MSSIHAGERVTGAVTKHTTYIKVLIASHTASQMLDISESVTACSTSKNIKGVGRANISLSADKNWLNHIYPNDIINIYFDKNDGKGWVRTFFGYVDIIEEALSVGSDGSPKSNFTIVSSDFMKAFERTNYYINPGLSRRQDPYFSSSVGGLEARFALLTSGVTVSGTPADLVRTILNQLMGFGGQYSLPQSYTSYSTVTNSTISRNRDARLSAAGFQTEQGAFDLLAAQRESNARANREVAENSSPDATALATLAEQYGVDVSNMDQVASDPNRLRAFLSDVYVREQVYGATGRDNAENGTSPQGEAALVALRGVSPAAPLTILDLVDTTTFMEAKALDGYNHDETLIFQANTTVLQLMRSMQHDVINEMIIDLRPVSAGSDGLADGSDWSVDPDELEGNLGGSGAGVKYVPAIVLREYPFSTVEKIDVSNVRMTLSSQGETTDLGTYQEYPCGALFSDKPNVPGRHLIPFPTINVVELASNPEAGATRKHLDVATISLSEANKYQVSRSDTDHFNLMEFVAGSQVGQDTRFYMQDFLPIISPIHTIRHGLRVRSITSKWCYVPPPIQTAARPTRGASAPTSADPTQGNPTPPTAPEDPVSAELVAPIVVGPGQGSPRRGIPNQASKRWGYTRPQNGGRSFRMHQGVDIQAQAGLEVRAIMDGTVVFASPNGVRDRYGACILIRHDRQLDGVAAVWSLYAHLGIPKRGREKDSRGRSVGPYVRVRDHMPGEPTTVGIVPGIRAGSRVRAGQHIGYTGWTGGYKNGSTDEQQRGTEDGLDARAGSAHLHFEICSLPSTFLDRVNPNRYPRLPYSTGFNTSRQDTSFSSLNFLNGLKEIAAEDVGSVPPNSPNAEVEARLFTLDPIAFYAERGVDLVEAVRSNVASPVPEPPLPNEDVDDTEPNEEQEAVTTPDQAATTAAAGVADQAVEDAARAAAAQRVATQRSDDTYTRDLMARWALLHDHWYQHNIEYLAGTIRLARGAPEIRVGYRLDIKERHTSFYVEGVSQEWRFPGSLSTTLQVTRGQPNNPHPVYVDPRTGTANAERSESNVQRLQDSRLGSYFNVADSHAVTHGRVIHPEARLALPLRSADTNDTDQRANLNSEELYTYPQIGTDPSSQRVPVTATEGTQASAIAGIDDTPVTGLSSEQAQELLSNLDRITAEAVGTVTSPAQRVNSSGVVNGGSDSE